MARILAVDIECRVCFGVAQRLGLRENISEWQTFALHPRQDVVAGAVQNAINAGNGIAEQAFAQRLYNGDAACHSSFEIEGNPIFFG